VLVAVDRGEHLRVDDVGVLPVPLEVAADERAQRHHELTTLALGVEGAADEGRADAGALVAELHLGVHEVRPPAAAHVADVPDELAVDVRLVPAVLLVVADLRDVVADAVRLRTAFRHVMRRPISRPRRRHG
jgi:hypothetical protein